METCALIYDNSPHYLDHLAPLCSLFDIPLIVSEPSIEFFAKRFFPEIEVLQIPLLEIKLPPNTIACYPKQLLEKAFLDQKTFLFWLPHGNSDKVLKQKSLPKLHLGDRCLIYGETMRMSLSRLGVRDPLIEIGNFRYHYFEKRQKPFTLPEGDWRKVVLYASTWDDFAKNCSLWDFFPSLASFLPEDVLLLVKPHPNTYLESEAKIERLKGLFPKKPILFLEDTLTIYPLLSVVDCYIGDHSSIGYDFLHFDRPLFFPKLSASAPLHTVGKALCLEGFLKDDQRELSQKRRLLYNKTFSPFAPEKWGEGSCFQYQPRFSSPRSYGSLGELPRYPHSCHRCV